jgi:hypothetical protein
MYKLLKSSEEILPHWLREAHSKPKLMPKLMSTVTTKFTLNVSVPDASAKLAITLLPSIIVIDKLSHERRKGAKLRPEWSTDLLQEMPNKQTKHETAVDHTANTAKSKAGALQPVCRG